MKEYGIDLQKQYNKVINDELSLFGKIKKRHQFLLKNTSPSILTATGKKFTEISDVKVMLEDIIRIEKAYTAQSKQLDMFNH